MDATIITLLIRIFAIAAAGGFIAYRFSNIHDAETGFKAAFAVGIALVAVIVIWFIAEVVGEVAGAL